MRQAVIVIHGIGQQRPLDTTRRLLDGVLGAGRYWSKPDRIQGSLDLRRFTAEGQRNIHPTDFFEIYWSHHLIDGRVWTTLWWFLRQAARPFWDTDHPLPVVRFVVQLGVLSLIYLLTVSDLPSSFGSADSLAAASLVVTAAAAVASMRFVAGTLSDAERYFNVHPRNLRDRDRVRREGVALLRGLHDSGEYFRVVVVGHSLGSVIGYDVLRQTWDELRLPEAAPENVRQPEAKAFNQYVRELPEDGTMTPAETEEFQQAQHRLWHENRQHGCRWLVTDFVTLGSPLAHARALLSQPSLDFTRRVADRELPVCPPVRGSDGATHYPIKLTGTDSAGAQILRDVLVAHHAGPFASTRWTNLFFPTRWLIAGDLVGGPVAPTFGPGVRDMPVRLPRRFARLMPIAELFPFCHSGYWRAPSGCSDRTMRRLVDRATGTKEAASALAFALRLETERSSKTWPPPDRGR